MAFIVSRMEVAGLGQWSRSDEVVGPEAVERRLAGLDDGFVVAVFRQTFEVRNTSSRS